MSPLTSPRSRLTLALAALTMFSTAAGAQTFTKITAATGNPIAVDAAPVSAGYAGCSWVDFDGDGDDDLFIVQQGLYRNDGGGVFTRVVGAPVGHAGAVGTTWADIDNDGDLDCCLSGGDPGGSSLYRNDGGAGFTRITTGVAGDSLGHKAWGSAWADIDRDGFTDLVMAAASGFLGIAQPNTLLRNQGDGTFTSVSGTPVTSGMGTYTIPSWSDLDDDGDPDLCIGAGHVDGTLNPDFLYSNTSPGMGSISFSQILSGPLATDARDGQLFSFVDIDGDRDLDVYVTNYGGPVTGVVNDLYRKNGSSYLKLTAATAGTIVSDAQHSLAAVWADFDNDGDMDVVVTNDGTELSQYYTNNGAGFFTRVTTTALRSAGPHYGACAADYDADGDVDLYMHGITSTKALFRNESPTTNGWLEVRCQGVISNRAAIGARVSVRATIGGVSRWQVQEVSAQNSFDGHSALALHFGLGNAAQVESLVVRWPSGVVQALAPVATRQRLTVIEDVTTAVQASLLSSEASVDRVRLVWQAPDSPSGRVFRARGGADWTPVATIFADAAGRLEFEDRDLTPGDHVGYRLALMDEGTEHLFGETLIDVPVRQAFALTAIGGAGPTLRVRLAMPRAGDVRLEVYDVRGRRLSAETRTALGAGAHDLDAAAGTALVPGLYWVRATFGGSTHSVRGVVTR